MRCELVSISLRVRANVGNGTAVGTEMVLAQAFFVGAV